MSNKRTTIVFTPETWNSLNLFDNLDLTKRKKWPFNEGATWKLYLYGTFIYFFKPTQLQLMSYLGIWTPYFYLNRECFHNLHAELRFNDIRSLVFVECSRLAMWHKLFLQYYIQNTLFNLYFCVYFEIYKHIFSFNNIQN